MDSSEIRSSAKLKSGNVELKLFPLFLDDCVLIAFSLLAIILASERSFTMMKKREEDEKSDNKNTKTEIEAAFPNFQLEANLFLIIPLALSGTLLALFFFFAQLNFFIAVYISVCSTFTLAFTLQPLLAYGARVLFSMAEEKSVTLPTVGATRVSMLYAVIVSTAIVITWLVTANWFLLDALGVGLLVWLLCHVKLPNLRVAAAIFLGLVVYDIFWVFFSQRIFHKNVMVEVAMQEAKNPVGVVARSMGLETLAKASPEISLPGKFLFEGIFSGGESMLGLGDVFVPGLLACYTKMFDYRRLKSGGGRGGEHRRLMTYFTCSLCGASLGLLLATIAVLFYRVAQPALIYIVPATMLPLLLLGLRNGEASALWTGDCSAIATIRSSPALTV